MIIQYAIAYIVSIILFLGFEYAKKLVLFYFTRNIPRKLNRIFFIT